MSASQRPRWVSLAAVLILLAGCDAGDGGTADPAPSAPPSTAAGSSCPPGGATCSGECPPGGGTCSSECEPGGGTGGTGGTCGGKCMPEGGTCRGDLAAGTYRTATFRPPITYTVPAGWTNGFDLPRNFLLARAADPVEDFYGGNAIQVMPDVVAAAQNCEESGEPGVGRTAGELARWVAGLPAVKASRPAPATVGGWHGFFVDIELAAGWTRTCPIAEEPMVPLLQTGDPAQFHPTGTFLPKGGADRLYLLDAPDGGAMLVTVIDIPGGMSLQEYLSVATPVIESVHFGA